MCGELNEFWHITVYDVQHLRHQTLSVLWVAPPDLTFYILKHHHSDFVGYLE